MSKIIKLPDIGEGIDSVEISEVSIKPGDKVSKDDTIVIVETEKASMEIPASAEGIVSNVLIKIGDSISPGDNLFELKENNLIQKTKNDHKSLADHIQIADSNKKVKDNSHKREAESHILPLDSKQAKSSSNSVSASPSVRRFARELGCDLDWVTGSGPKGRIRKEDVQEYIKSKLKNTVSLNKTTSDSIKSIDFSQFGETSTIKLNKIRRVSGQRLQEAWNSIPHVTQFDKADITELDDFRKELNSARREGSPKMSYLPFMMKALVPIFEKYPDFCASLDQTGKNLIHKKYIHIGIAVDTPNGLMVPVIRDINKKSVPEIMIELTDISSRAREKKISPNELQGGCFTISSLGGISGTGFTPIVNPPEVAILGISRTSKEPIYIDKNFEPRIILPISLSYDHRVIDGAIAANFTKLYCESLSDFKTIPNLNIY